jgi:hypothetical protein
LHTQFVWRPEIVIVEKRDPLALGMLDPGITRRGHAR